MNHPTRQAFTLIELLIVISIIAVLTSLFLPVYSSIQLSARRTQSLNNMRQFGTALIGYCGDHDGVFPSDGTASPTWAANTPAETNAWYNVLPRNYTGGSKGLADFVNDHADFYAEKSLFYVPAAKYPANKLNAPLFALTFCSKLSGTVGGQTIDPGSVRLTNFQSPAQTCIFQESGLPGEKPIRSTQSSYNGQSKSFASRSIARYGGKTVLAFADGHADLLAGTDLVDTTGKAYNPQIGPAGGRAYWTMNPALNANQ